jgi:hypothetical protein
MNHRIKEVDDESGNHRQQHVQGHVPILVCPIAAAAMSRCLVGRDHALGKQHQSGKQTEEADQEEQHEHYKKHVAPARPWTDRCLINMA